MGSPQATVAHQEAPCMQIMGPSSELHGAQSLGDTAWRKRGARANSRGSRARPWVRRSVTPYDRRWGRSVVTAVTPASCASTSPSILGIVVFGSLCHGTPGCSDSPRRTPAFLPVSTVLGKPSLLWNTRVNHSDLTVSSLLRIDSRVWDASSSSQLNRCIPPLVNTASKLAESTTAETRS